MIVDGRSVLVIKFLRLVGIDDEKKIKKIKKILLNKWEPGHINTPDAVERIDNILDNDYRYTLQITSILEEPRRKVEAPQGVW